MRREAEIDSRARIAAVALDEGRSRDSSVLLADNATVLPESVLVQLWADGHANYAPVAIICARRPMVKRFYRATNKPFPMR